MSDGVVIAIIGAIPALITAVVSVYLNNQVLNVKIEALQESFNKLEKKVDAHNNFMERIAKLEQKTDDLAS